MQCVCKLKTATLGCLLLVSSLLPWTAAAAAAAAARFENPDAPFDYFILSREWPYSFCSFEDCTNKQLLKPVFNIHGLWPESENGDYPDFCKAKFEPDELKPILESLKENWIDLKDPNDESEKFWKTEFKKHGSCAAQDPRFNSTLLYFNTTLQLHLSTPLLQMLQKEGIKPGNDPIQVSNIRQALAKHFGFRPSIRCRRSDSYDALLEIRLCFTKDKKPRNCNSDLGKMQEQALRYNPLPLVSKNFLQHEWSRRFQSAVLSLMSQKIYPESVNVNESEECKDTDMVLLPTKPLTRKP